MLEIKGHFVAVDCVANLQGWDILTEEMNPNTALTHSVIRYPIDSSEFEV